jgi:uncharacterized protein YndB with AHSA1/START domain
MAERSVQHSTLVLERLYEAPPERAFAAWADPEAKRRWFAGPESEHELDFRVGGRESSRGPTRDGRTYVYEAIYRDIVPVERIVLTYEMEIDGTRFSISVLTVEFAPADGGTRLVLTEQGVFLDGREEPDSREQGWGDLLDALAEELS